MQEVEPPDLQMPALVWPEDSLPPAKPEAEPFSWTYAVDLGEEVPIVVLDPLDEAALRIEDDQRDVDGLPLRIGVGRDVDISLGDDHWYDIPGVGRLWVIDVLAGGAIGIRVHFTDVDMPEGARLIVYALADRLRLAGPYRLRGIHGHGQLWTPTRFGDVLRIEYFVPAPTRDDHWHAPPFRIDRIQHIYRDPTSDGQTVDCDPCGVDVTCYPEWEQTARAVVGIGVISPPGSDEIWCTATLLTNASEDYSPFLLTAAHCIPDSWASASTEVYWLYQGASPISTSTYSHA